jgi:hypothetical protein
VRRWGNDAGRRVSVNVELHHEDLIPSADTLSVRYWSGSRAGELRYRSASPAWRTVEGAVAALEVVAEAAERLYGQRDEPGQQ